MLLQLFESEIVIWKGVTQLRCTKSPNFSVRENGPWHQNNTGEFTISQD